MIEKRIDQNLLDSVFRLLGNKLEESDASPVHLVVCGGSALIATGLFLRTTKDVDVVAFRDESGNLVSSRLLPEELKAMARDIARDLGLMENWLNPGPADLFEMGLPAGFEERLISRSYGKYLTVSFIGRMDQIHFKVYASVDRAGYHVDDLKVLEATESEMETAARWAMTHDVSDGFRVVLKDMLRKLGYGNVADRI